MKMNIKIKKLHPDARIPEKATPGAAGYDLYLPCECDLWSGRQRIPLGLAIELPEGYEAKVEPRSGYSTKGMEAVIGASIRRIDADVLVGKIDADYRGEICLIIHSHEPIIYKLWKGQRIAQLTIYKAENAEFELTDTLTATERGEGGFGSTGA